MTAAREESTVDVVRVIARLNVGGPALHVINAAAALRDGYRSALVFGDVAEGEADMSDRAEARGIRTLRIPELGRSVRPWHDLVAFARLYAYLRRVRPQVVHTHTAKAGTLGRLAAVLAGVPVRVHTFHGHVFHGYFGPVTTRLIIAWERALSRFTAATIAISPLQARDLTETYRVCDADRVRVIPLGLELDAFDAARNRAGGESFRRDIGASANDTVVTMVGRLVPIKNHDLLLAAAARLIADGRRCVFAIVGGGPEAARITARIAELGLSSHVRMLGWRADLGAIYAGSDLVALTSHNEGTPVSLIEAMASERAVVATSVGGVADLLEGGRLGRLVPANDAIALSGAIADLIDQPEKRAELGARASAAVLSRYGVERLARDLGHLYDDLLGARRLVPTPAQERLSCPIS